MAVMAVKSAVRSAAAKSAAVKSAAVKSAAVKSAAVKSAAAKSAVKSAAKSAAKSAVKSVARKRAEPQMADLLTQAPVPSQAVNPTLTATSTPAETVRSDVAVWMRSLNAFPPVPQILIVHSTLKVPS